MLTKSNKGSLEIICTIHFKAKRTHQQPAMDDSVKTFEVQSRGHHGWDTSAIIYIMLRDMEKAEDQVD